MWKVKAVPVPKDDFLASKRSKHSFRDALSAPVSQPSISAAKAQLNIFSRMPKWVDTLMNIRNKVVKYFGFKVAIDSSLQMEKTNLKLGDAAGFMTVISVHEQEIVSFAEDKHMQFYMSVTTNGQHATVSTLVNLKTPTGRLYMALITPFHWIIARVVIHNAVKEQRL
ncbi:DUF2867 domain-containing protein [Pseudoalteromonas sp. MMG013]|uniref:DUF2867 domain-containing protein n=1 Tax=Pseudoalteromonas sp. MMG013 TaxID=2822687 RepID=UPI001B3811FC|nr:DUF2867 domain-containing protein [Pseudoalteromonas sp. MMG013]MBQ4861595.1 DUF2867 domain-containing protein [Pseudoalteromonas sp. MMG013]